MCMCYLSTNENENAIIQLAFSFYTHLSVRVWCAACVAQSVTGRRQLVHMMRKLIITNQQLYNENWDLKSYFAKAQHLQRKEESDTQR